MATDAEWTTLTTYLGGESVAGGKLKETGTTHWLAPNTGATNETGFTALPGCYRLYNGAFHGIDISSYWWSASEYDATWAWHRGVSNGGGYVDRFFSGKASGYSVRCVKDDTTGDSGILKTKKKLKTNRLSLFF